MVRISAIFLAMGLIAGSIGAVLCLRFGFTVAESTMVALGAFTTLGFYSTVAGRLQDRAEASDRLSMLSRSSGDLARQLAEFGCRLDAMETKAEAVLERSLASAQPPATELEELVALVNQLADSVAARDVALGTGPRSPTVPATFAASASVSPPEPAIASPAPALPAVSPAPAERALAGFSGLDRDGAIDAIRSAIDANSIDLYLQPIVTLPQRKVRYYEAMPRLKIKNGEVIAAADFLKFAEAGSLMPMIDHLTVPRCIQVVRRLLLKNCDIGLFYSLSRATLADANFPQLLEVIDANRAIAPSLVFEFTQSAVHAMGPIEHEMLSAVVERGFHFSMNNLASLRVKPRELSERGFRFIKAGATLLLNGVGVASTEIHPADFSELLGRYGIDLIADGIEGESAVVDLLDYDVRFGQGFLFGPPRPVRAEALKPANCAFAAGSAKSDAAGAQKRAAAPPATLVGTGEPAAEARATLAEPGRAAGGHG